VFFRAEEKTGLNRTKIKRKEKAKLHLAVDRGLREPKRIEN
jgi:hypothetical protein